MKAITTILLQLFVAAAYAQTTDTIVHKDDINLPVSNPAMNRSGTGGGPDQGGNQG